MDVITADSRHQIQSWSNSSQHTGTKRVECQTDKRTSKARRHRYTCTTKRKLRRCASVAGCVRCWTCCTQTCALHSGTAMSMCAGCCAMRTCAPTHTDTYTHTHRCGRSVVFSLSRAHTHTRTHQHTPFVPKHTQSRIIAVHRCLPQFTVNVQIESFSLVCRTSTYRVYYPDSELKICFVVFFVRFIF